MTNQTKELIAEMEVRINNLKEEYQQVLKDGDERGMRRVKTC